jgi:ABC-type amino acid transport substrate-binding protein
VVAKPFIIPVFIPHAGCPHRCVFCNQTSTTGQKKTFPKEAKIRNTIDTFLKYRRPGRKPVEIAYFGGNFLGLDGEKIKMLLAGRVDLALYIKLDIAYNLRQIGKTYDMVEPLFLASGDLWYYLAFSKGTSDEVVEQFQQALDEMKQDGAYDALLEKYMK